jgi:hypothetical protein
MVIDCDSTWLDLCNVKDPHIIPLNSSDLCAVQLCASHATYHKVVACTINLHFKCKLIFGLDLPLICGTSL